MYFVGATGTCYSLSMNSGFSNLPPILVSCIVTIKELVRNHKANMHTRISLKEESYGLSHQKNAMRNTHVTSHEFRNTF